MEVCKGNVVKNSLVCMKSFLLIFFSVIAVATAQAQADSWKILFRNKIVLKGDSNKPDTELVVKSRPLKSTDKISIKFTSAKADNDWTRTFFITDEGDNNLITQKVDKQNGEVCVTAGKLIKLIKQKQSVFIYTLSTPKDKSLAARVRVRRMLLCKIEWK
jgi:hypothetical protein